MNSDIKSELEAIGVKVMVPDDPEPIKSGHQWEEGIMKAAVPATTQKFMSVPDAVKQR